MTKNLKTQITRVSLDATSATLVHVHEYFDEATQAELENAINRVGSQAKIGGLKAQALTSHKNLPRLQCPISAMLGNFELVSTIQIIQETI